MALVELSIVEQRYRAVQAVRAGEAVVDVARELGVSRQSVHAWVARYEDAGFHGLEDRSRRSRHSPKRIDAELEAWTCELRRAHPRWGPRRIGT
ncbi:MAG: helix-turn-helix domain-containing protein [Acidimicrobiales bacterium]